MLLAALDLITDTDAYVRKGVVRFASGFEDVSLKTFALLKLGHEADLPKDRKTLRAALDLIMDADAGVKKAAARFASGFAAREEFNDEIYEAWLKTLDAELLQVIRNKDRRPSSPSREALYYLSTGQVGRYQAMNDTDGTLFLEAWIMAPEALQKAILDTVAASGDAKLADAYQKALAGSKEYNIEVEIRALKTANDDERLFDAARRMKLPELLDLCERWASNGWRPADPKVGKVVAQAVDAFRKIGTIKIESGGACPPGTVDLFDYWKEQNPGDAELREGLRAPDPFIRARSLYMGYDRKLVSIEELTRAGESEHWPERLISRMLVPYAAASTSQDHVEWINLCGGIDAGVLSARVDCTPDEFEHFRSLLKSTQAARGPFAGLSRHLIEILHEFQRHFASGSIVVEEDDSAGDRVSIVVEEVEVAPEDMKF